MTTLYPADTPVTIDQAELLGWEGFVVGCPTCGLLSTIGWPKLRRRTGHRRLTEIRIRLRCQRCGSKPDSVRLHRETPVPGTGQPKSETAEF